MITSKLDTILLDFESFLQSHTPQAQSFHPHFQEAVWEMMKNGGKRFRPALIFCVVDAFSPEHISKAFFPALAMEAIHTFSLIHDDLPSIDNASLRRGHPTLHTKYNEVTAILSGDFLNSYAFDLITQSPLEPTTQISLISTLALGTCQMIIGEALDCYFEDQLLNLNQLQNIHTLKTAKLIASSLKMGGIIANLSKQKLGSLWDLGILLGIFFQIRDDLIDTTSSQEKAGKPIGQDIHKNNYVNLLGIQGAKDELAVYLEHIHRCIQCIQHTQFQINLNTLLEEYLQW
ncbi:polyprenyl synthetase family protein [Helicobacter kayseriensis]|uniref:polyprenyl synthetase family protein n=1 Tax=Helicobacter kayseriensis TaxID=2905877 RepID=UPI001E294157|nr:polyprenyl synthetase family protein [Helicobacter kayseriensis]MCE3046481.1 polyprenyl synthetase family protein [Helicobacter kayseriensis]MCE3048216.1 polyprenyl synthetase family protein [Helicobacter kayseriensis]